MIIILLVCVVGCEDQNSGVAPAAGDDEVRLNVLVVKICDQL